MVKGASGAGGDSLESASRSCAMSIPARKFPVLPTLIVFAVGSVSVAGLLFRQSASARDEVRALKEELAMVRRDAAADLAREEALRLALRRTLTGEVASVSKLLEKTQSDCADARSDARFAKEELESLKAKSAEQIARLESRLARADVSLAEARAAYAEALSAERSRAAAEIASARDSALQARIKEAGALLAANRAESDRQNAEIRAVRAESEAQVARITSQVECVRVEEVRQPVIIHPCPRPEPTPPPAVKPTPPRVIPLPGFPRPTTKDV